MNILITGGAGFIGSHTCVELLNSGYHVIVADNFCNSGPESLNRVQKICGKTLTLYEADLQDRNAMDQIFSNEAIDAVIHFAGLKAVGESVKKPLEYYRNNLIGTLLLCDVMRSHSVYNLVFSSSATVYGDPASVPIREDFPLRATNPYGRTKLFQEEIFRDLCASDEQWKIILLRYFNPIGAHESGEIGEDPKGIPNNLLPYIAQVAIGRLPYLNVYGNDYATPDGTGVRDYIHVTDLAKGHVKALEKLQSMTGSIRTYNLGTGVGYSVLDVVKAFEKASGCEIPCRITARRAGDIAVCYADPSLAKRELDWQAERGLTDMCADAWHWQKQNPNGYA